MNETAFNSEEIKLDFSYILATMCGRMRNDSVSIVFDFYDIWQEPCFNRRQLLLLNTTKRTEYMVTNTDNANGRDMERASGCGSNQCYGNSQHHSSTGNQKHDLGEYTQKMQNFAIM